MPFSPIEHGTLNWDVPVNQAFEDVWTELAAATFYQLVAASDAPASVQSRAQYVCDGTADDVQIQAAIDAALAEGGGRIILSAGTFNLAAQLVLAGADDVETEIDLTLIGQGPKVTTLAAGSGARIGDTDG